METTRAIGFTLKALSNQFKRIIDRLRNRGAEEDLTGMQYGIVHYVFHENHHGNRDIYQRDIEKAFNIRRSTATGILQLLEKNDWICRQAVPQDARLKRIVLTQKACDLHHETMGNIAQLEKRITRNISEEELAQFYTVARKLAVNMEKTLAELEGQQSDKDTKRKECT